MEQPHANAVLAEGLDEFGLCLEQLPAGRQVAAVLVAVGIPEHHFLRLAPRVEHARVHRNRQQRVHRAGRVAQVRDRLEQRDDVAVQACVGGTVQADFAQQQHHLEHVGHAVALRDHVVGDALGAVERVHARRGLQDASSLRVSAEYSTCRDASCSRGVPSSWTSRRMRAGFVQRRRSRWRPAALGRAARPPRARARPSSVAGRQRPGGSRRRSLRAAGRAGGRARAGRRRCSRASGG